MWICLSNIQVVIVILHHSNAQLDIPFISPVGIGRPKGSKFGLSVACGFSIVTMNTDRRGNNLHIHTADNFATEFLRFIPIINISVQILWRLVCLCDWSSDHLRTVKSISDYVGNWVHSLDVDSKAQPKCNPTIKTTPGVLEDVATPALTGVATSPMLTSVTTPPVLTGGHCC